MISIGLPKGATFLAGELVLLPVMALLLALLRLGLENFFCGGDRYDGSSIRAFSLALLAAAYRLVVAALSGLPSVLCDWRCPLGLVGETWMEPRFFSALHPARYA